MYTTPNLDLQIPPTGSASWDQPLDFNFNKLDQFLGGQIPISNLSIAGNLQVNTINGQPPGTGTGGGGGGTISVPHTLNILAGDGSGGVIDSTVVSNNGSITIPGETTSNHFRATGSAGAIAQPNTAYVEYVNGPSQGRFAATGPNSSTLAGIRLDGLSSDYSQAVTYIDCNGPSNPGAVGIGVPILNIASVYSPTTFNGINFKFAAVPPDGNGPSIQTNADFISIGANGGSNGAYIFLQDSTELRGFMLASGNAGGTSPSGYVDLCMAATFTPTDFAFDRWRYERRSGYMFNSSNTEEMQLFTHATTITGPPVGSTLGSNTVAFGNSVAAFSVPVILSANPTSALGAAPKQYVDAKFPNTTNLLKGGGSSLIAVASPIAVASDGSLSWTPGGTGITQLSTNSTEMLFQATGGATPVYLSILSASTAVNANHTNGLWLQGGLSGANINYIDMSFQVNTAATTSNASIRYERRSADLFSSANTVEFQFLMDWQDYPNSYTPVHAMAIGKRSIIVNAIEVYANNAAAVAGGLTVGALYRDGADPDTVHIVH